MSIPWDWGVPCYSNRGHSIYYWLGKRSSDVQIQTSKEGKREVMSTRNRRAGNGKKRGLMGNKLGKQQFQRFSTAVSYQEAIIALSPLLGQDKHLFGRGALELFDWRRKMSIVQRSWESFFFFYNGSTWCSERGLVEQELERHEWSISANKAGENSNISLSISRHSPWRPSLLRYQLFLPSPPVSTCLHLLMLICCFSDTHHWGSHF